MLPVSYEKFTSMVQPGDTVFLGRYLVTGSEDSSLYLTVRPISLGFNMGLTGAQVTDSENLELYLSVQSCCVQSSALFKRFCHHKVVIFAILRSLYTGKGERGNLATSTDEMGVRLC